MRARDLGHVALQYWVQLGALSVALVVGRSRWAAAVVLALYLLALLRTGAGLRDELPQARGHAFAVCVVGQLPGLALSIYVALCFSGLLSDAFESVVLLQAWTAMWAPLVVLAPRTLMLDARAAYLWLTLSLPFLQLACLAAPQLVAPRAAASRAR